MVDTRRKHVKCFTCKRKLFNEKWIEAHCQQYHQISMNEGQLPEWVLPPGGWDRPEPSWFNFSRCTWMAIDELGQLVYLPIDNVPRAPPPEDTPDEETIDPETPDLTRTPDHTKTRAHSQVVEVENAGGKPCGKATGLYNKHRKHSEQWNPWHPVQSAHDFQQAQSFSQQTKMWIDQHLRCGLDNFTIESFQSVDALWKLLSRLDLGLGNDSWIEDNSHIFGTLYYRDIVKCVQVLLAHLPIQAHLDFELVCLTHLESRRIQSEMNTGNWWWDTQDQLPAGLTIVPVICTSGKTQLTNSSSDQHAWPLYLTIGNIQKNIRSWHEKRTWILVGLICCPPKGVKNTDKAWHSTVETVLSPLRNLDITGPGLKCDCPDGFQKQCYPLLAAWVSDYLEQVMVAQVSYGLCPMCEISKGAPMGHSTFRPLDNPRDQPLYLELLDETNINVLHTLGIHPICNQFWQ